MSHQVPSLARIALGVFALLGAASLVRADESPKPPIATIELQDGDALVFLGDSITHQCLYTQYVEDYFYTRFPTRRIRFYNAGIGGDKCGDALLRFEEVAAQKPKYVTVLLGMNDGQYQPFNQAIFDTYEKDARQVVAKIVALGAKPILMTPTMFDRRAAKKINRPGWPPKHLYYNSVLAYYGRLLQEIAYEEGYGFVDMYGPLNRITLMQRKVDPGFTLIRDSVHPEADGQVVMACALLEDMAAPRVLSTIRVALHGDKMRVAATGGKVSEATSDGDRCKFTYIADALPFVLPPDAALGDKLTNAGHRLSAEKLQVLNLKPGKYALKIDGETVGEYAHAALAQGVELQRNQKTPQFKQALAIANLNREKNMGPVREIRNLWLRTRELRNAKAALAAKPGDSKLADRVAQLEKKLADVPAKIGVQTAKVKDFEDRIYASNAPKPHVYSIAPAAAAKP